MSAGDVPYWICNCRHPNTKVYYAEEVPEAEARIRADERAKCAAQLEDGARQYIEKWGSVIGEDRAKSRAFDIICAARSLTQPQPVNHDY